MRILTGPIIAALLVVPSGCENERVNTESPGVFPKVPDPRVEVDVYRLEDRLEDLRAGQEVLVEALAQQNLPLDPGVIERLKNNSGIALQWIDNEDRGALSVTQSDSGVVSLSGTQTSTDGKDIISLQGRVVLTTTSAFIMIGTLDIDVQEVREAGGPRCHREGVFTFRITGGREYWRLLEKNAYCGVRTDYVDIFF